MTTSSRFSVRVSTQDKQLIENAAHILGYRTVSAFIASTLVSAAKEVKLKELARIREERLLEMRILSDVDRDLVLDLLENPTEPNKHLKKLVESSEKKQKG